MDRPIVYPGAIPLDSDILNTNRNAMVALGYLAESAFGSSTFVSGLACTATAPTPDLNIHIGRGMIGQLATIDATAYGALLADTADPLFKMGINTVSNTFPITPPTTNGFSQNYLVECQLQEIDASPVVLPYYNAANPAVPYSGPANNGVAQNTVRTQRAQLQVKAGVPAAAGTQVTPGADAGWVPLYVVSVNYGQTQITAANIARAPSAPFIGTLLTQGRTKLAGNLVLYVDSVNGSDTINNGLLPSLPLKTIQAAANAIANTYDLNGFGVTILLNNQATYAGAAFVGLPVGFGVNSYVLIAAASTATISNPNGICVSVTFGAQVEIGNNVTFTGQTGVYAYVGSAIFINGTCTFGTCSAAHIQASGGTVNIFSGYTISGNASVHWNSVNVGQILVAGLAPITLTLNGTPSFQAFALSFNLSTITIGNTVTYNGSATGTKFSVATNGVISTNGAGGAAFPGNVAGTTTSGGQCI